MTDPVSKPGVPPGINPPGQHNGQQQPPFVQQQQSGMQQQTQQQRTDAIIMQILQQLQQQQVVTNQLLQQQQQSAQQQHGFMQQQGTLFRNALSAIQVTVPPNPEVILDSLAGNIREFQYDPENQITFATLYARYEDLFAKDAKRIDDEAKVRLLLRRLGTNEHYRKRSRERSKPSSKQEEERKKPSSPCWNCGAMHFSNHCSFKGHKCVDCKQVGHKEGYCASAKRPSKPSKHQSRRFSTKSVTASVSSVECKRRYVWVKINGTPVRLQLDTASDITIVSEQVWNRIGQPAGVPATQAAKSASGEQLDLVCEFVSDVEINGTTHSGRIFVSYHPLNLLGIDLIEKFQLWSLPMDNFCNFVGGASISKAYLQKAHPKLFSDTFGLCSRTKVQLSLKESCKPVFRPKRPVSYAMLPTVDKELDRLERMQIISPVDYSEWAAPIVVVCKASGNVRICGDYSTGLNDRLQSHQYPLPLPQDIIAKLSNCTVFSQIDLSDAFLQMEVDESCRHLLTINTHRGLYQYNRLPPGVKAAPGAFQQLMDTMLAGLPCTTGYLDDVVVGGKNAAEHQRNQHAVLQRLEEFGFTIRLEKCSFGKQQIRYLGHLLDRHGLRPDPAKIQAIKNLPPPKDITGVRSFLGAINYYGKYVPNMRALRFPLDELLKNTTAFVWTHECQQAFNKFKEILSSDLLLAHYDPRQEIVVSADASSIGIGATISHKYPDGHVKVIQHASRALTQVEQRYSQIDREGLAIIYAVTNFHKFIFGRRFHLQTDHQPLLRIFGSKKGIPVYTANRLQRWALSLLSYDFSIEYAQTDKFGNADILSRLINQHTKPDEDVIIACTTLEEDLRSVAIDSSNQLPLSFSMVEKATASDPSLRKVHRFIRDGWPKSRSEIKDRELARYYDRQEALSVVQGNIMFGDRLVIPTMFRRRCLIQLHKGHPGIQRMKAIKGCSHYASVARSPPKAEPESWHPTTAPWQRVHADYAGPLDGEFFLLVIDAHTKWPEIFPTSKTTTSATIRLMRKLFANKGMPELLVTDNGSQFKSAQFDGFCCKNGIRHTTTVPYHPQSNGQAERFVDTFKRAVKKIQEEEGSIDEALDVFLLTYRTTPNRNVPGGKSPAEAMYNRPLRTSLDLLRPPSNLEPSSNRQQTSNARSFSPKTCVYAKIYANNKWSWFPGTVVERIGSVMYNIWVDNRRLVRSHINQLRQRAETATKVQKQGIPLNILLDEWNLPVPASQVAELSKAEELEPSMSTLVAPSPSTPTIRPATVTSSSSSASTAFESAVESSPTAQLLWRSSRTRRLPQRFQAYRRY
ncbi:uncharacterized protein K02A2.6-like [Wyeomyia smithii]|uniref:uncharacterized protein K02A2.6-like n=1 Tax=Wyeomyia smithii TaxID=174621 RepID=UPI002467CF9B|nr:uncharacterized protein K02A2.6-like [Wyeomyia smithii]